MNTAELLQRIEALEARVAALEPTKEETSIPAIQRITAAHFGISVNQLLSVSRQERIVIPRMVAMMLARECGLKLEIVGQAFGRDHTSVSHAVSATRNQMETNTNFRLMVESLRTRLNIRAPIKP